MADLETLKGLLARVQAATGPDRKLWCEVVVAILDEGAASDEMTLRIGRVMLAHDKLAVAVGSADGTTSIDAAITLMERALPGWDVHFYRDEGAYVAEMIWPEGMDIGEAGYFGITGRGPTRALAILCGILEGRLELAFATALLAQAEAPSTSAGGKTDA